MDSSEQNYNPSENYNNIQQKKGKGRKKTTNEKIENRTRRQVSFSKRRTGLFKKANEIGTLCATENVVVVHSPAGKVHSFGSPSVERVAHRFLNQTESVHGQMVNDAVMAQHSEELTNLETQLALELKHQKESLRIHKKMQHLDELDFQQLDGLMNRASSVKMDFEWGNLNAQCSNYNQNHHHINNIGSVGINNSCNVVFSNNPTASYGLAVEPFNIPMAGNPSLPSRYLPPAARGSSSPMFSFNYGEMGGTSVEAQRRRHNNNGRRN